MQIAFTGYRLDTESGLYYAPYRYQHPVLGLFVTRDPLGYVDGMNLYGYCGGRPVDSYDPWGMLGEGRSRLFEQARDLRQKAEDGWWINRGHRRLRAGRAYRRAENAPLGHSDLPGSHIFDFNKEDDYWRTSPNPLWGNPAAHFQTLAESTEQVMEAINDHDCNQDKFERAMHRGQDSPSHYDKHYRWDPFGISHVDRYEVLPGGVIRWGRMNINVKSVNVGIPRFHADFGLGHGISSALHWGTFGWLGENPDADVNAWNEANQWTRKMLAVWYTYCCTCGDSWNLRSKGPCDDDN